MTLELWQRDRRSIRLREHDYSQAGAYFVTICTQRHLCLFGTVADDEMCPNDAGIVVSQWWYELGTAFPDVKPDVYVVMPNHFHGILLVGATLCGRPPAVGCTGDPVHVGATLCGRPPAVGCAGDPMPVDEYGIGGHPHRGAPTVGDVVGWFKTMTTNEYIRGVKDCGWPAFPGRLWQRNYYERIVRKDAELASIRQYIADNPVQWAVDRENPAAKVVRPKHPWES